MNKSEFQTESADQIGSTLAIDPSGEIIRLESFQASLESLILGYRLRGWLTDSEKTALDCLAPSHHICFLMKGEEYLHPVDCELFSHDTIRSSQSTPGEALFQHRWEPDNSSQRGAYSIHSAQINPYGETPITLGLLGPEADALAIRLKERFGRLIEMARHAWKESNPALDEIKKRFGNRNPYLLINRCSGRIIHASQPALDLFDCPAEQIIDQEFSGARPALAKLITSHRLKMTRFTIEPYLLASVELTNTSDAELIRESGLTTNLIHKLRNKLTSIMSASSYLVSGTCLLEAKEEREMKEISEMIQIEAQLAEKVLARMQLLIQYNDLAPTVSSLTKTLKQSAQGVSLETGDKFELIIDSKSADLSVSAPPEALMTLLQTVILAHVELGATHARVKSAVGPDGPIIVFSSDLAHAALGSATLWSSYSRQLAELMDIRLASSQEPTTGMITTLEFTAP